MSFLRNMVWLFLLLATPALCLDETVLIDKEFTVLRSDYKEFHYLVPSDSDPVQFQGSFSAKGGFYDDLNFLIFKQSEYAKWYSHRSNQPLFKVEKKKEQEFRIDAEPGETYYFVMDNFFSTVSNKKVKLTIKLVPES